MVHSGNEQRKAGRYGRGRKVLPAICVAVVLMCALLVWAGSSFFLGREKLPAILEAGTWDQDAAENRADLLISEAEGMLVQVESHGLSGSGVILAVTETDLRVVTAAHVLRERTKARVTFCDGSAVDCTDIRVAQDADVAFLQVPLRSLQDADTERYRYAATDKERYDALTAGDRVFCLGAQDAGQYGAFEGILTENWIYTEDFAQYMMVAQCQVLPGMSGGGLYDERGYVIGIVCGGNEQGELAAVPLHVVLAKYEEQY